MKNRMAFKVAVLCLVAVAVLSAVMPALAAGPSARIGEAVDVLREMSQQADVTTMAGLVKQASGIAIFPSVVKAGLVLGGRYGEGLLLRRNPDGGTWSGPYFVTMKGVSYGPQIGVQQTALVLVIANERGMKGFTGDKVTLGGEMAVAAGPVGRQAAAATDVDLKASIYSYSISRGIFAGMSLEGAVIEADDKTNKDYWGSALSPQQMLEKRATDSRIVQLTKELDALLARSK